MSSPLTHPDQLMGIMTRGIVDLDNLIAGTIKYPPEPDPVKSSPLRWEHEDGLCNITLIESMVEGMWILIVEEMDPHNPVAELVTLDQMRALFPHLRGIPS